jgi:hypothetical protein
MVAIDAAMGILGLVFSAIDIVLARRALVFEVQRVMRLS